MNPLLRQIPNCVILVRFTAPSLVHPPAQTTGARERKDGTMAIMQDVWAIVGLTNDLLLRMSKRVLVSRVASHPQGSLCAPVSGRALACPTPVPPLPASAHSFSGAPGCLPRAPRHGPRFAIRPPSLTLSVGNIAPTCHPPRSIADELPPPTVARTPPAVYHHPNSRRLTPQHDGTPTPPGSPSQLKSPFPVRAR